MNSVQELDELVSNLLSRLREGSTFARANLSIRRINHRLKMLYKKIWDRSTDRSTREGLVNALEPICEKIGQISTEVLGQINFTLRRELVKGVYLVGGVEVGKNLLNRLKPQVSGNSSHLSSIADLARNVGLFNESLAILEELKLHGEISGRDMYNVGLLRYMSGKTNEALDAINEMEAKRGIMYASSLKTSIFIALNKFDKAKNV